MQSIVQLQRTIETRVTEVENSAKEIRRLLLQMNEVVGTSSTTHRDTNQEEKNPFPIPGQFQNKPLGMAVREYLAYKRGPATLEELIQVLRQGGADLGTYPKRSVKLAIVNNHQYFELRGVTVYLKDQSSPESL